MANTLHLGWPTVIESHARKTPYGVIFEDDGKLAYFYAMDSRGESRMLDAVCIYHITAVVNHQVEGLDAGHPYEVRIVWSPDEKHVALLLDDTPHAVYDFEHSRAFCRSNFPERSTWSSAGHDWDDHAVEFLVSCSAADQPETTYSMLSSVTS